MSKTSKPCVLVTRASHQAQAFIDQCELLGYNTVHIPCIKITPVAATVGVDQINEAELVLFTSVNAVEHAHRLLPLPWPTTATGVGTVTTARLAELGQALIQAPKPPFTSEGFIDQLDDSDINNIVIVKGVGGRIKIQQACKARGVQCTSIDVYARALPAHNADQLSQLLARMPPTVIATTSNEVLQNLVSVVPEAVLPKLKKLTLLVNSTRGGELARDLGFSGDVLIADPPGDEGQLAILQSVLSRNS